MMQRLRMMAALAIMVLPVVAHGQLAPFPMPPPRPDTAAATRRIPSLALVSRSLAPRMAVVGSGFRVNGGGGRAQLPARSENQYLVCHPEEPLTACDRAAVLQGGKSCYTT
jgi:hypothetical protein